MINFITNLMRTSLDLCVERAHRPLTMKPRDPAPPRSIIVRFSDYRVKEKILQQAWKNRGVTYQGQNVFFDQNYTSDVQKQRKQVRKSTWNPGWRPSRPSLMRPPPSGRCEYMLRWRTGRRYRRNCCATTGPRRRQQTEQAHQRWQTRTCRSLFKARDE